MWFFSKMFQVSQASIMGMSLGDYSGRLPKAGTMQNGVIYEHQILALRTEENDGYAWPTPTTDDAKGRTAGKGTVYITQTGTARCKNDNGTSSNLGLANTVKSWPTPQAQDGERGFDYNTARRKAAGLNRASGGKIGDSLKHEPALLPDIEANGGTGQLNPDWVETLMGYPIGWTDIIDGPVDQVRHSTNGNRPELWAKCHIERGGLRPWVMLSCPRLSIRLRLPFTSGYKLKNKLPVRNANI